MTKEAKNILEAIAVFIIFIIFAAIAVIHVEEGTKEQEEINRQEIIECYEKTDDLNYCLSVFN